MYVFFVLCKVLTQPGARQQLASSQTMTIVFCFESYFLFAQRSTVETVCSKVIQIS